MQPKVSWQSIVIERLRQSNDWLVAGDLFNEVEQLIQLQHATRHCKRSNPTAQTTSIEIMRWRYFMHVLGQFAVEWESGTYTKNRQYGERIRLAPMGVCPACGDESLIKTSYRTSDLLECRACGVRIRQDRADKSKIVTIDKSKMHAPLHVLAPAAAAPPPAPHPLLGYQVVKRRPGHAERHGTIVEIVPTGNLGYGDLALIHYGQSPRADAVALVELSNQRNVWELRRPEKNPRETDESFDDSVPADRRRALA